MSWTTPAGVSHNHTPLFCGRTIEHALVSIWAPTFLIALGKSILSIIGSWLPFYLCITPAGRAVLGDRAFHRDALKYPNCNPHLTPSFLEGRKHFTAGELVSDKRIYTLRYTAEQRLYARA